MPKTKKPQSSASESDSDSGPEDRIPPAKKAKSSGGGGGGASKNADGDYEWQLDRNRALKVREFKGKLFVDIREYYEKDGKLLPGKKGISLSVAQWKKVTEIAQEVDDVIKRIA
ncbi:hypothetical protein LSTR_LSTR014645 [Laodelphax striatellus]|uniref:Transcriptional coactivator p15 (PC4) C-terminal domain-containing protein n=1 Tax=Laodelphax striatellus TaxID=195883 RepID=A0A482XM03_LAOST|nr:hypothetical protein LSTR_LSTR014645 [Laodelphax striatellus]